MCYAKCAREKDDVNNKKEKQISRVISHDRGQFRLRLNGQKNFPGKKDHPLSRVNFSDWAFIWEKFFVPLPRDSSAKTAHVYALIKEVNHHVYVKRQTRICTTWPSFPFTCRLLFIISTQITSFTQFFVHKNCFGLFLSAHFLFQELLNFNLPFAVYVKLEFSIVSFWPSWPEQECDPCSRPNLFFFIKTVLHGL